MSTQREYKNKYIYYFSPNKNVIDVKRAIIFLRHGIDAVSSLSKYSEEDSFFGGLSQSLRVAFVLVGVVAVAL